jgi:adenine-specific DNA methylase
VLASHLLTDYPFRDWRDEPELPFGPGGPDDDGRLALGEQETAADRYYRDTKAVLEEVGRRHTQAMADYYPTVDSKQPWGYLWAVTLPCQECGRRFPLVGSYQLRMPSKKKAIRTRPGFDDPGQSYYIHADTSSGQFHAIVHDGLPRHTSTLANRVVNGRRVQGKSATCPFCDHVHGKEVHQRLAREGKGSDVLLVVADHDEILGKVFREPTDLETLAASAASEALADEPAFSPVLPAVPHEGIAVGNSDTIRPSAYGATTYGDLMIPRQTLSFIRLAKTIDGIVDDLREAGLSDDYIRALSGSAAAQTVRQVKRSTRGTSLDVTRLGANHIFVNESTIAFSYDSFEAGIGTGPGTWDSMSTGGLSTLRNLLDGIAGVPTDVVHGTATEVPLPAGSLAAVVTDPPYDEMIAYSDASDLFYVWLKRALFSSMPELALTADPNDTQDKVEEIIVKRFRAKTKTDFRDHRTREHYDILISRAFAEMRRVVRDDGVVTIVFGHGDPEVWQRLLGAITGAGLVLTGSWPANTEKGGQQGQANITTTLTMACRPAAAGRSEGAKAHVETEVRAEVAGRIELWEKSGLAPTDMLMASAGPAMEVVGRYSQVVDIYGDPVDPGEFLVTARRAVRESARVEIDHHPLDTFDARTRFALWWVKLFGKDETAKSELRWQTLADDLDLAAVRDLVPDAKKGVRFADAAKTRAEVDSESAVIDVALAMARAWADGAAAVGQVLAAAGKESDPYLWAAVTFLADRLPDSDKDAIAFTGIVRNRKAVTEATRGIQATAQRQEQAGVQESIDFSSPG